MPKRFKGSYGLAIVLAFCLIASLITDLIKIKELQSIQRADAKVSLVWFLTQADRETRTFLQSTSYYYLEKTAQSREQMLISFDILWSRYDIELNGQMELLIRSTKPGPELLDATRKTLRILDPLVQNLQLADNQTFSTINRLVKQQLDHLFDYSIHAMQDRQATRSERLATLDDLYNHLLITLFTMLVCSLILIVYIFKRGKSLKFQRQVFEHRVEERTEQLRQSNQSLLIEANVRKQADQKAQQLISAINQSKEVVFILNADNEFIFFNQSFKQINGEADQIICLGDSFASYLDDFVVNNQYFETQQQAELWKHNWLTGLETTKSSFEIPFSASKQFIFNIDRLEDGSVISIGADISALKETQIALAASESRFRNFAMIGADWYWETDTHFKLTYLAGGLEKVSGLSPGFFVGKDRDSHYGIKGAANQRSLELFWQMMDAREPFHEYEATWRNTYDKIVTISISGEPRYDSNGKFTGYIGAGRDVTERCLVEERDKRLLTAINSLNLMVTIFDDQDNLIFYNREFEVFKQALAQPVELGINFEKLWRYCCDYYAQNFDFDGDHWFNKRMSIHREPISNFVLPISDDRYLNVFEQILDDGGVIIISTDISSSKKAEQEIYRLRKYLANIIDSMSSVLIAVDTNCRVIQWNSAAQIDTGISLQDAYQKKLSQVFPRLEPELNKIEEAIHAGKESFQLKRLHIKDGNNCYEDIIIYPLISGEEAGAVIRLDNVTEQVMISEMMIQSEKMLSVGGLAAGMAHEINNPLAGMMQTASVLLNRLSNEKVAGNAIAAEKVGIDLKVLAQYMDERGVLGMLHNIVESGNRVALIVENMLNFSRQNSASSCPQSLVDLLEKSLELSSTDHNLQHGYDIKHIRIVKEYQGELPQVVCEAGKIQQVLLNILRNAAQAMQEACVTNPTLTLSVNYDKALDQVVIEIEDNGPGITDAVKRRIFEPFFSTKKEGLGTGLGLSVSYFIITENHGGQLSVDSVVGQCTKFKICLPRQGKPSQIDSAILMS